MVVLFSFYTYKTLPKYRGVSQWLVLKMCARGLEEVNGHHVRGRHLNQSKRATTWEFCLSKAGRLLWSTAMSFEASLEGVIKHRHLVHIYAGTELALCGSAGADDPRQTDIGS